MNAKCFHIGLAIWIFAIAVPIGFAESFQYRPTASEMDELVTLGTECGGGVKERCYATQIDPPTFIGTNGWYLTPSTMETMASKIKLLVQYYVDPGTEYEMYTVPGLFTELDIGDHASLFTATPANGTNAATYGDYPGRIYVTNLQERYNVIYSLQATFPVSSVNHLDYWHGNGCGSTYAAARADAEANYVYVSSAPLTRPLDQHCKGAFWSSNYLQYIPGEYDPVPRGSNWTEIDDPDTHTLTIVQTNNVYYTTNLWVTCENQNTMGVTTNLVATSLDADPNNVIGTYVENPPGDGAHWYLGPAYIFNSYGWLLVAGVGDASFKWTGEGAAGTYDHFISSTGTVTVAWGAESACTVSVARASCQGLYTYSGTDGSGYRYWNCTNGFTVSYAPEPGYPYWTIRNGSQIDFTNATYNGEYSPNGHIGTATVTDSLVQHSGEGGAASGIYSEGGTWPGGGAFTWTGPNGFYAYCDDENYYITTNLVGLTPAWTKGGDDPNGTFSGISGEGIYGTAEGTVETTQHSHWEWVPVYGTYTWGEAKGGTNVMTNTVFYQCWLTKVGWSNAVYVTSNIPFASSHYVYSIKPAIATTNIFNNEGLEWNENVWNLAGTGSGSGVTNEVLWVGGDLSDPPADTSEPTTPNESTCAGFMVTSNRCLLDWVFQYCK